MPNDLIKHLGKAEVMDLAEQVDYLPGQIVSKTVSQNGHHSVTLFAFAEGEEISTHESQGDAWVIALDGLGRITIDGKEFEVPAGKSIIMPANTPHAVFAKERFKMLLLVIFD